MESSFQKRHYCRRRPSPPTTKLSGSVLLMSHLVAGALRAGARGVERPNSELCRPESADRGGLAKSNGALQGPIRIRKGEGVTQAGGTLAGPRPRGGRGPPGESRNEAPSRSSASLAPSSLVEGPPSMEDLRLDHSASSLSRLASYLFPHSRFLSPPRVFSSAALLPPPPPPALLGPALVRTRSIHL